MEELDYEDVLSIHPDEDLKKIEPNETYADSPLDEATETDANSNLEPIIEIDASSPLEGDVETEINLNSEPTIEIDASSPLEGDVETEINLNSEPTIEIDADSNLDCAVEADANSISERSIETNGDTNLELAINTKVCTDLEHGDKIDDQSNMKQTDTNANVEQNSDSDSGEIDDDEEANDLEEGEIKENNTILKKKSDIACRFFKRGSCAFGSQCQYLHVSDTVYKMFDTNQQKRKELPPVEHQHFIKPIIFSSNVLLPRPFIEPPISVAPKADPPRQYDSLEDNWDRCLEQARILVQKKRKFSDVEPKNYSSKNNDDEKAKEQYLPNESPLSNSKKYSEKTFTNNNLRRADTYNEKRSNYKYQQRPSDSWVDPWRRSKSRQRSRSRSQTRSRKHSYSSSASSTSSCSSEFNDIYKRPYKKKSPSGGRVSKSRSVSQTRQSKKRRISPKHSFNGRRNLRSSSKSVSRSPGRRRHSPSRSRTSSLSYSSSSDREESPPPADKEMQRISAKLSDQFHERASNRASPMLHSDCETSELTVSSASCTSLSSDSETESPLHSPSSKRKQSPIRNNTSSYSNKNSNQSNPKVSYRSDSHLSKSRDGMQRKSDVGPTFRQKSQPYNSNKNQNSWNIKSEFTDSKPKNIALNSNSSKKHVSEFSKNKKSEDMNMLFMYQDMNKTNNQNKSNNMQNPAKAKQNNLALKSNKTDIPEKAPNKTNSNSETSKKPFKPRNVSNHDMDMLFMYQGLGKSNKNGSSTKNVTSNNPPQPKKTDDEKTAVKANSSLESHKKLSNVSKQNTPSNMQLKSKSSVKLEIPSKAEDIQEMVTVQKKVATSKREKLLNKLKLIDDAIARKKCK